MLVLFFERRRRHTSGALVTGVRRGLFRSDLLNPLTAAAPIPDVDVTGLTLDSRLVQPGDLFFAVVQGVDRYQFIDQVIERGAVAVIGERADLELSIPH